MTATRVWYPHYIRDFRAKTRDLSCAEKGAYRELIDEYWERQGPLPADDAKICRIIGASPAEWAEIRATVLAFFQERDGLLYHSRVEEEMEKAREQHEAKAARMAKARANNPKNAAARSIDCSPDGSTDRSIDRSIDRSPNRSNISDTLHLTPSPKNEEPYVMVARARGAVSRETKSGDVQTVIDAFCAIASSPPTVSPRELVLISQAIDRHGTKTLLDVCERARGSPFLRGETATHGPMPLKWLWDDERIAEVLRGQFDGNRASKAGNRNGAGVVEDLSAVVDWAADIDRKRREASPDHGQPGRRAIGSG